MYSICGKVISNKNTLFGGFRISKIVISFVNKGSFSVTKTFAKRVGKHFTQKHLRIGFFNAHHILQHRWLRHYKTVPSGENNNIIVLLRKFEVLRHTVSVDLLFLI